MRAKLAGLIGILAMGVTIGLGATGWSAQAAGGRPAGQQAATHRAVADDKGPYALVAPLQP